MLDESTHTEFLPPTLHPALRAACAAADDAFERARSAGGRAALIEKVGDGADGTATSRLDQLVENAVLEALDPFRVNVLSEECGYIDNGSALTVAIDPVDGTGNAAAGLPLAAFTAAIAVDDALTEGFTFWFDTGRWWHARRGEPTALRTSGRVGLQGALVSMIRPKHDARAFLEIANRADRTRVLGSSSLEAAWVASGVLDAFADAGSDTHRYVDLAAAVVLVEAAGGAVIDAAGRPLCFSPDITRRFSGIAAATRRLAEEIASVVTGIGR